MSIAEEVLKAKVLRYFPANTAKKYLIFNAKKDLEFIKKFRKSLKFMANLEMIENSCCLETLAKDCEDQIKKIIKDPFFAAFQQQEAVEGEELNEKEWAFTEFYFTTKDEVDYLILLPEDQFVNLWAKLLSNTIKCLKDMRTKPCWHTGWELGNF